MCRRAGIVAFRTTALQTNMLEDLKVDVNPIHLRYSGFVFVCKAFTNIYPLWTRCSIPAHDDEMPESRYIFVVCDEAAKLAYQPFKIEMHIYRSTQGHTSES